VTWIMVVDAVIGVFVALGCFAFAVAVTKREDGKDKKDGS
jgi:hypothetical protein